MGLPLLFLLYSISCAPVFTAEINGYVLDEDSFEGIGGVELRFYTSAPKGNDDKNFLYQTSTSIDGDVGYFYQNIIWSDYLPTYWEDGDVVDMYCTILHPDYEPTTNKMKGIVSGASNAVASVFLKSLYSSVDSLQGSVYTIEGPVNDVQVALYLKNESNAFTRTYTRNINGIDGQYLFENIKWIGNDFITGGAKSTVYVEDPRFSNPVPAYVTQELYHQETTQLLPQMTVVPARPEFFQAEIRGTVAFAFEFNEEDEYLPIEYLPIPGEEIEFSWFYNDEEQSIPRSAFVRSDENGNFSTMIEWEDEVQDDVNLVPLNQDQINVDVSYPHGTTLGYLFDLRSYNSPVAVRSWQENLLPSAFEFNPEIIAPVRPESFQATIRGSMAFAISIDNIISYQPITGEEVEISWFYNDEEQSIPRSAFVRSDENGNFSTTIEWEDSVQDNENLVPLNQDQLDIDISYPYGNALGYSFDLRSYDDTFTIRSWQDNPLPSAHEFIVIETEE